MRPMWARLLLLVWLLASPTVWAHAHSGSAGHHEHRHKLLDFNPKSMRSDLDGGVHWELSLESYSEPYSSIEVTWWGVSEPSNDDQLALYPCKASPFAKVPANIVNASALCPDYLDTGKANVTYPLFNMRDDFCFKLIRGGIASPVVVAEAPPLRNDIPHLPSGLHLALAADGRSIVVQWTSGTPTPQTVQWGAAVGRLDRAASSSKVLTYTADQMCGSPANSSGLTDPGHMHLATIPGGEGGMQAGQRYWYRVGSQADGWSSVKSFLAPLPAGVMPEQGPLKFLVFNDVGMIDPVFFMNVCPPYCPAPPGVPPGVPYPAFGHDYAINSTWLSKILPRLERDAHLALLIGDLSYAQGFVSDWDAFGHQFEPSFSMWPMMVALGNHERDWPGTGDAFGDTAHDSGGECGIATTYRFFTPAAERSGWDPRTFYYSFSMGPVHFVVLDSESPTHPDSAQGRFVAEDLASVDRSLTPWVVVGFHRMMYAPLTNDVRDLQGDLYVMQRLQDDLEDVFRGQVDLVVSGHSHAYGRTCPVYKQQCVEAPHPHLTKPGAPVYVLSGNAGAGFTTNFCPGEQVQVGREETLCNDLVVPSVARYARPVNLTQPDWLVVGRMFVSGYMRLFATHAELRVEAVGSHDGSVFDEITLRVPSSTADESEAEPVRVVS